MQESSIYSAKDKNVAVCLDCNTLVKWEENDIIRQCPNCHSIVFLRKPYSLSFALVLNCFAALFFLPANYFPIVNLEVFGKGDPSTIIESVLILLKTNQFVIALIIFLASFFIPLTKILAIFFIVYSIKYREKISNHHLVFVFHLVESLGKWGMLDIFVAFILVTLVRFGGFGTVTIESGANFFAIVVLLTMFAAHSIDTRLIWDKDYE
ncbi:MAG: paraquat-inducible protein A [Pseudobacteriovorax sp.]|nr:paraquat-inducible protein A [Pseudobacteriovorax sp.]